MRNTLKRAIKQVYWKGRVLLTGQPDVNYCTSDPAPTFPNLTSQLCTVNQFESNEFREVIRELEVLPPGKEVKRHRKAWEYAYICQALVEANVVKEGSKGLGFAVGTEPITAFLAKRGCLILATDLQTENAILKGWSRYNEHANHLGDLNLRGICPLEVFERNVSFRFVDMNNIPSDLKDFNFLWSSCSFEHLGSIQKGLAYVVNAMNCIKPGGVAVHTTEFNLTSNDQTVDIGQTVLFRMKDMLQLKDTLEAKGHKVLPFTFNAGKELPDKYIDLPPYETRDDKLHLKLQIEKYAVTSIGIIIFKGMK